MFSFFNRKSKNISSNSESSQYKLFIQKYVDRYSKLYPLIFIFLGTTIFRLFVSALLARDKSINHTATRVIFSIIEDYLNDKQSGIYGISKANIKKAMDKLNSPSLKINRENLIETVQFQNPDSEANFYKHDDLTQTSIYASFESESKNKSESENESEIANEKKINPSIALAIALRKLAKNESFYNLCQLFNKRHTTILSILIPYFITLMQKTPDYALVLLPEICSDAFKRYLNAIFLHNKETSLLKESINHFNDLGQIFNDHKSKAIQALQVYIRLLGSEHVDRFLRRYRPYRKLIKEILHKSLLLIIAYPNRTEHEFYIAMLIMDKGFLQWIDHLDGAKYVERYEGKYILHNGPKYLILLLFTICLHKKNSAEFLRYFCLLTSEYDLLTMIKGGNNRRLRLIIELIHYGIFFEDFFFLKKYVDFFLNYNQIDKVKFEIFKIVTNSLTDDAIKPMRRLPLVKFFLSDTYHKFFKKFRQSSIDVLIMMTHLAAFSMRYEINEYFKIITEEKLFAMVSKLNKKDRIFHNYLELFKYIEGNLESKTLRLRLIVFFYFHFSQIAFKMSNHGISYNANNTRNNNSNSIITSKSIQYLNDQHLQFSIRLEKRYFRARNNSFYQGEKDIEKKVERYAYLLKNSGNSIVTIPELRFFIIDPDMEQVIYFLRLDLLMDIIGRRALSLAELQSYRYLLNLSGNRKLEDELYVSLPDIIKNNDLVHYEQYIRDKFHEDPFNLVQYLRKGGFYKIFFNEFKADIIRSLLPVVQLIPIKGSDWAKTDRKNIYLPLSIYEFNDRKQKDHIHQNRNFSLYIYLGLHEFSHWLANSFEYDFNSYFFENCSKPDVVFSIFNIIEDFRSEYILMLSEISDYYKETLLEARKYYALVTFSTDANQKILQILMFELYWQISLEEYYKEKTHQMEVAEAVKTFKNTPIIDEKLVSIGFMTYQNIVDFMVNKIREMPIESSLNSIRLSMLFFDILSKEFNFDDIDPIAFPGNKHSCQDGKKVSAAEIGGSPFDPNQGQIENGPKVAINSIEINETIERIERIETNLGQSVDDDMEDQYSGHAVYDDKAGWLHLTDEEKNGATKNESKYRNDIDGKDDIGDRHNRENTDQLRNKAQPKRPKRDAQEVRQYLSQLYQELNDKGYQNNPENIILTDDYQEDQVIDLSHRTVGDSHLAESMLQNENMKANETRAKTPEIRPGDIERLRAYDEQEQKRCLRREQAKKKAKNHVFTYNNQVKGYTDIRELEIYTITGRDQSFFDKYEPYTYIHHRIAEQVHLLLPELDVVSCYSNSEGEIDPDKAIEIFVPYLQGESPEIFQKYHHQDYSDIEIIIGLDASGSTEWQINEDLCILDVEKIFAYLLGKSFYLLTPNVSVYAFNSLSSTNIYQFPQLDDISMLKSGGANRDGDFIRYINNILHESNCSHKYFFLLSDGQPNASNYDGDYAVQDTAMAMRESLNQGIKLIYFNIDPDCSQYFSTFIPNTTYAENFREPTELLEKIQEMVLEIAESVALG